MRATVCALAGLAQVACTTLAHMDRPTAREIGRQLDPGDRIELITRDHRFYAMTLTKIARDHVEGRVEGELVRIPVEEIQQIRHQEISVAQTLGAGILGYLALIGIGAIILVESFD
jgi:hypothetical protein